MEAGEFLEAWGVDRPTVDVLSLARRAGIKVYQSPDMEWLSALDILDDEARLFTLSGIPAGEERFAAAHAMGHVALHKGSRFRCDLIARVQQEREANLYAQDLLVPSEMLDSFYEGARGDVRVLAHIFGVPEEAMRVRIRRYFGGPL
ncbi:MAG: ImmA/IrrE family metallo-endopeptidase [Pseudomonadota bacterium]|nr:ImmA/IrrE family metallo-endopeptidase [Pseudomonadota bacterium]